MNKRFIIIAITTLGSAAAMFAYSRFIQPLPAASDTANNQNTQQEENGWPVIIFNHGYIQPEQYRTTEKYVAYTDAFSKKGYIVFKSDYRGHGNSEGNPAGAYYSPTYTIDVLNAVASIKKYKDADPERIGMWGHSMGGAITLRSMVVTKDIKAGVIWAGVIASYDTLANNWHRRTPRFTPSPREQTLRRPGRQELIDIYGSFEKNPQFWRSIAPISFVADISGPYSFTMALPMNRYRSFSANSWRQHSKMLEKQWSFTRIKMMTIIFPIT